MKKNPPNLENPYLAIKQLARDLRDKNGGCPWDIEQTHSSLRPNLIEEAYEVLEALDEVIDLERQFIDRENSFAHNDVSEKVLKDYTSNEVPDVGANEKSSEKIKNFKEELGDLLFQVVIHSQLANEKNWFSLDDVLRSLLQKLIFRHPHVYGKEMARDTAEVLHNWEKLKKDENRKKLSKRKSILDGIPVHLPALARAQKLGAKAAKVNFDWPLTDVGLSLIFDKVKEELAELEAELPAAVEDFQKPEKDLSAQARLQKDRFAEELGDLLFSLSQLARFAGLDAELVLRKSSKKFSKRFISMEKIFSEKLTKEEYPSLEEWENAWEKVKQNEK